MEEALDILWTYARREPIESNGKTIVATISQSIAAIRLIMRLEGWLQRDEKQKVKSEKQAAPAYATPTLTSCDLPAAQCLTSDLPMPAYKGKAHDNEAGEQFAQTNIDTPASTCLAASSPREEKFRTSQQEPNHPTAKASYHTSKPRKVCHQRPYVKDDKSPKHTSKPRKVCLQRLVIKEGLYKEITLIESPIRSASLNCVSNLTLAKALPP
ncbi:hypothetical protein SAMN05444420_101371 [Capnocytophaga granulosa]|uniref:Uncharacterized protein n=1 Tax=Capnocytophaga granulosa TaxID=45242 RepID=A0A1H2R7D6_9FLAO|nr:hypothetical protein [Capnocytophaga granulosa]EPD29952.1 hypothetical protein HMPREF9331_00586 [Capnocytophaga granulosa ATCC 51502]SDW15362.1 hypothetical protein SAMN05444420_101371 [Capnocytophaga granulosa]SUX21358.1 Uncharacterised protein [Capnocytophaga granulosa]